MERVGLIVLSGGVDSSTTLHYMKKELKHKRIYAISFVYGQLATIELEMAKYQAKQVGVVEHRIVDISFFGELVKDGTAIVKDASMRIPTVREIIGDPQPPTYVPFRNVVLLTMAASFAEVISSKENSGVDIYYGAQITDTHSGYWDATIEFVEKINELFELNRKSDIKVRAPFYNWRKGDIVRWGIENGMDYSKTYSCYTGEEEACGVCVSCSHRIKGFIDAGYPDPYPYKIEIPWKKLIEGEK